MGILSTRKLLNQSVMKSAFHIKKDEDVGKDKAQVRHRATTYVFLIILFLSRLWEFECITEKRKLSGSAFNGLESFLSCC